MIHAKIIINKDNNYFLKSDYSLTSKENENQHQSCNMSVKSYLNHILCRIWLQPEETFFPTVLLHLLFFTYNTTSFRVY